MRANFIAGYRWVNITYVNSDGKFVTREFVLLGIRIYERIGGTDELKIVGYALQNRAPPLRALPGNMLNIVQQHYAIMRKGHG